MSNKSSGLGTAIALLLWCAILFLFATWPGEPGWMVWIARVLALLSGLAGILGLCTELSKGKKNNE